MEFETAFTSTLTVHDADSQLQNLLLRQTAQGAHAVQCVCIHGLYFVQPKHTGVLPFLKLVLSLSESDGKTLLKLSYRFGKEWFYWFGILLLVEIVSAVLLPGPWGVIVGQSIFVVVLAKMLLGSRPLYVLLQAVAKVLELKRR